MRRPFSGLNIFRRRTVVVTSVGGVGGSRTYQMCFDMSLSYKGVHVSEPKPDCRPERVVSGRLDVSPRRVNLDLGTSNRMVARYAMHGEKQGF